MTCVRGTLPSVYSTLIPRFSTPQNGFMVRIVESLWSHWSANGLPDATKCVFAEIRKQSANPKSRARISAHAILRRGKSPTLVRVDIRIITLSNVGHIVRGYNCCTIRAPRPSFSTVENGLICQESDSKYVKSCRQDAEPSWTNNINTNDLSTLFDSSQQNSIQSNRTSRILRSSLQNFHNEQLNQHRSQGLDFCSSHTFH